MAIEIASSLNRYMRTQPIGQTSRWAVFRAASLRNAGGHGQGGQGGTPTWCGAASRKHKRIFIDGCLATVKSNRGP